jgi:hypothetical protein
MNVGAGCAMYTGMDYSIRIKNGAARFEVHDTSHDQAPSDLGTGKRRAVLSASTSVDYFKNGKTYELSFDGIVHWDSPADQLLAGDGHQLMEMHTGSHPAFALRLDKTGKLNLTTSDEGSNIVRYAGANVLNQKHNYKFRFMLGTGSTSYVQLWIDGVSVGTFTGGVGSTTEDDHKAKFGIYAGNGLSGNRIVMEVSNVSLFPVAL